MKAAKDGANVVIAAKTAEPHPKLPGTIYTAAKESKCFKANISTLDLLYMYNILLQLKLLEASAYLALLMFEMSSKFRRQLMQPLSSLGGLI